MPGGRPTHKYPHGKPTALVLVHIAAAIVGVAWLALFSWGWLYRVLIALAFLELVVVQSNLNKSFERSGLAVRIPRIPRVVAVSYPNGVPSLLRWLRVGFFVAVIIMLLFGFAPMPLELARIGIIGCVLGQFLLGIVHFLAERHFVNTGQAKEEYEITKK
jgi:xanthosine utilization system XapX-like protein